jgi:hypothetical protein
MARVDHVFVFCRAGAPERGLLVDRGLAVGVERAHPGQGTHNACFGCADAYLELIWLADERTARGPVPAPLALAERSRWREGTASPFGICLRPDAPGEAPPFRGWRYRPPYLPDDIELWVADNERGASEPVLFWLDRPYAGFGVEHALAHARLLEVAVSVPGLAMDSVLATIAIDGLTIGSGADHRMAMHLDATVDQHGREIDLHPDLPLVLRW